MLRSPERAREITQGGQYGSVVLHDPGILSGGDRDSPTDADQRKLAYVLLMCLFVVMIVC